MECVILGVSVFYKYVERTMNMQPSLTAAAEMCSADTRVGNAVYRPIYTTTTQKHVSINQRYVMPVL